MKSFESRLEVLEAARAKRRISATTVFFSRAKSATALYWATRFSSLDW
jgi:hypothetical protein